MNFKAFDTETVNRRGHGEACLLIKWEGRPIFHEFPRSWDEIFKFLEGGVYVAWNMDFDARAIVHDRFLPFEAIETLGLFGAVDWDGYSFKYIPGKFLEVYRGAGAERRGFTLYDIRQFYGLSLAEASRKFLPAGQEKDEIPKAWYNEMDRCLRDSRRARVLSYAGTDVERTQSLTGKLLASVEAMGIKPRRLSSCAGLAKAKFGKVLKTIRPPDYLNEIFKRGFFGGRIEVGHMGKLGTCKLYDLHSAYPSEIAKLVNPNGIISEDIPKGSRGFDYGVYDIEFEAPRSWYWGPLAVRRNGSVIYPVGKVRTNCGEPGRRLLIRLGLPFKIHRATTISCVDQTPLFPEMAEMYLCRKDPALSLAIKTAMNSLYGVMAESTNYAVSHDFKVAGARAVAGQYITNQSRYGRFTNFILASHVTESIRVRIFDVLNQFQGRAYFAATDGVLVDSGCEIPTGPGLGEWDLKRSYTSATILGNGRYILEGEKPELHLRGFPVKADTFERLRNCRRSYFNVPCLETDSLKQWAGNCSDDLNVLQDVERRLEISDDKRYWMGKFKSISEAWEKHVYSMPFIVA